MSLKSTFLPFKKSCKSCPNWEGGGNLDKIQKNSNILLGCLPWVRQKIRQLVRKTIFDDDHRILKPFCERKKVFFTLLWHLFPSIHAISWMFLASASPLTPSSSSQLPWSSSSCYYHLYNFVNVVVTVNNIVIVIITSCNFLNVCRVCEPWRPLAQLYGMRLSAGFIKFNRNGKILSEESIEKKFWKRKTEFNTRLWFIW